MRRPWRVGGHSSRSSRSAAAGIRFARESDCAGSIEHLVPELGQRQIHVVGRLCESTCFCCGNRRFLTQSYKCRNKLLIHDPENTGRAVNASALISHFLNQMSGSRVKKRKACPHCGQTDCYRTRHYGPIERYLLRLLKLRPYRCENCHHRFYSAHGLSRRPT